jgi:DNA helicase-2/ATP-dependent DNA helicase PcrA
MPTAPPLVVQLWQQADFTPNDAQRDAILHVDGPLYLPAGPGSGKTRVLLWRTVNLIVCQGVAPDRIYLSTFTEKAARQLREGLRGLLALATNCTGRPYDTASMYVGTVHSLCQRLIVDRRFYAERSRSRPPVLLDELGQYFYLYHPRQWDALLASCGTEGFDSKAVNAFFGATSGSRHAAVTSAIGLFNRLSEECLRPEGLLPGAADAGFQTLLRMYAAYLGNLRSGERATRTDFSMLQQEALRVLDAFDGAGQVFQHVIVDEYQDTNTVQERLFFQLAAGSQNLCVVGDDDQALYRFRGARVENFVQFPGRCRQHFEREPRVIPLAVNYRSRPAIVDFYNRFMAECDWATEDGGSYRVTGKLIRAANGDEGVAVVTSTPGLPGDVGREIAGLVRDLLASGVVTNENQIAFLFPSLKSTMVAWLRDALEAEGLRVYAPRAGTFLGVPESVAMFGCLLRLFGRPQRGVFGGEDYSAYQDWLDAALACAERLCQEDKHLAAYLRDRQAEVASAVADYQALTDVAARRGWDLGQAYAPRTMKGAFVGAPRLSEATRRKLASPYLERIIERRIEEGRPATIGYLLSSVTALDWSVLDLFYRLCGFDHFRAMFDLAERGEDEGPICNLGLISQYLARYMEEYGTILTAPFLGGDGIQRAFFGSYLFALFRRGGSEYEDAEDPFPRGRIPFLTVHQAKGLEFPVVVVGSARKDTWHKPSKVEQLVHPLVDRQGEPLERMSEFDAMRLFYVALSRAKNLLVIARPSGRGYFVNPPFNRLTDGEFPRIPNLDLDSLPPATVDENETAHAYSYTGDYLFYQRCPRQYMVFRKYGFVPSRSQTQMFGTLIHRTLDDLHQFLIARREEEGR